MLPLMLMHTAYLGEAMEAFADGSRALGCVVWCGVAVWVIFCPRGVYDMM